MKRPTAEPQWMLENPKDGSLLVLVPGGKFIAGGPGSDEGKGAFPVELPAFHMGVTAVTNAQYARFVRATKHRKPDNTVWQEAGKQVHPVVCVNWGDAQAYCGWAGLRLPTELEWEKAARGTDGREFPWGKDWDQAKCRNPKNKGNGKTAGVWEYASGISAFGCYQMSGNVWEWCADGYDSNAYYRYKRGDITISNNSGPRVVRGGSWDRFGTNYFRCAERVCYHPAFRLGYGGFRVARSSD